MSEADKMFEELGHKKHIDNEYEVEFYCYDIYFTFDKKDKTIQKRVEMDNVFLAKPITIKELKAINKKVEELKWL